MRALLFLLLLLGGGLSAQTTYAPPLRGPLLITGTFGELRSNHFHAGLDFRGIVGTPVYCVADGFVSRIVVSAGGYGQAIYVDHPDGRRSVYAHLETFRADLLDTVRARQYAEEEFAQDLHFDSTAFPVQLGDQIGEVGNRGFSFGPHLHFEIRDIVEDAPLNPFSLGFPIADTRAPQIRNVRIYELDGSQQEQRTQTLEPTELPNSCYVLADTVVVHSPRIGLSLKAYDRQNALPNWNGIYAGELLADSVLLHHFAFNRIPYDRTRYLNAMTDYADWVANQSWYHRFWALTPEALFSSDATRLGALDGSLQLRPGQPQPIRMRVLDYAGNVAELSFTVVYQPGPAPVPPRPHQYFLPAGEPSLIENGDFRLYLGPKALYRDCYFRYARLPDTSAGHLSDVHQIHSRLTPLHGQATLHLRPREAVPESLRAHVYLGQCDDAGNYSSNGGEWEDDGRMRADISSFGDYALFLDTIPPRVNIEYFNTDLRRAVGFSLQLKDNVRGGQLRYRGTIDGKWVLLEHDAKSSRLNYNFGTGDPGPGEHLFVLTADDGRGNSLRWERRFRR